jgi:hypothetical protein
MPIGMFSAVDVMTTKNNESSEPYLRFYIQMPQGAACAQGHASYSDGLDIISLAASLQLLGWAPHDSSKPAPAPIAYSNFSFKVAARL